MKVGVIGAGTMGSGIAQAFAQTEGYEVMLCDINETFAANGKNKIAKGFEKNDSRIKLLTQKNSGVSEARNVGIKTATGKYITFVDSDDWLELDMYEKLMERIENPYKYLKPDIMLEGKDEGQIRELAQGLADLIKEKLA